MELRPLEWFAEGGLVTDRYVREGGTWGTPTERERSKTYDRYDNMMKNFAHMVRDEKQNPWSYDYELQLYKMVLKACGVNIEKETMK